jgi:hypothetical protein
VDGNEYFIADAQAIEDQNVEATTLAESREADLDELRGLVQEMAEEARHWREENFDPFLAEATKFYRGEPFGNEVKGRSQIVLTVVRDAIRQTMPSLLRVFFGPERVVEFIGRGREDADLAKQQTDFVNLVVREDNEGFLEFHSWFKDALVRRLGVMKWWFEKNRKPKIERFQGVTLAEIGAISRVLEQERGIHDIEILSDEAGVNEQQEQVYDVEARFISAEGRVKFAAIPAEEMVWSPDARNKHDAMIIGHVRDVPADELIAMGFDEDLVAEHAGKSLGSALNEEVRSARRVDGGSALREPVNDDAAELTQFSELYARIDVDEDGIAELRRYDCIGTDYVIANGEGEGELVDEIPFSFLTPEPEPHEFLGLSMSDITMDLQKIQSFVVRAALDSLAIAIDPVTEVVANEVNMKDVLSRKLSRIVRVKRPNMMREVPHRWVGPEAMEMLAYLDQVKESRTGRSKASQGLDPSVLQSTTKAAVQASVTGSQQQLEMIARIFAETGVADLYRGILRLLVEHKEEIRSRIVRLRGNYIQVDPDKWDATLDVRVNVALGTGLIEDKLQTLGLVLEKQEALMQQGAPFITWRGVRTTLAKIVELAGWPTADEFFEVWGPQEQQQFDQEQQQKGEQPSPEEQLVQIEAQRVQQDGQIKVRELELKEQDMLLKDDRERDKTARTYAVDSERVRNEASREQGALAGKVLDAAVRSDRNEQDAGISAAKLLQDAEQKKAQAAQAAQQPGPQQ